MVQVVMMARKGLQDALCGPECFYTLRCYGNGHNTPPVLVSDQV